MLQVGTECHTLGRGRRGCEAISGEMQRGVMLPSVLVDFDGTVVLEDTTDLILERFADPAWRTVETAWIEGRIGSRECLSRQIDLVRASVADLDELADATPIDPDFSDFIVTCRDLGLRPVIGSDGVCSIPNRASRSESAS